MSEWQPIETAPKDGTCILVINDNKGGYYTEPFAIGVAAYEGSYKTRAWYSQACCDGVSYFTPTHWMPLPEAPKDKS